MRDQIRSGNCRSLDHASGHGGQSGGGRSVDVDSPGKRATSISSFLLIRRCDSDDAVGHNGRVLDRRHDSGSGDRRAQQNRRRSRRNVRDITAAEVLSDTGQLCNILSPRSTILRISGLDESIFCESDRIGHLVEIAARSAVSLILTILLV